jgi:hypothetical protein
LRHPHSGGTTCEKNEELMPPEFFEYHWEATAIGITVCLWISICLILRVWIIERRATFMKKLLWSMMLLIPGLGWLAYGALFRRPGFNDTSSGGFDAYGGNFVGYDSGGHGGSHGGGHGGGHGDGGHGGGH